MTPGKASSQSRGKFYLIWIILILTIVAAVAILIFFLIWFYKTDKKAEESSKRQHFIYPNARRNESIFDDFDGTKVTEGINVSCLFVHILHGIIYSLFMKQYLKLIFIGQRAIINYVVTSPGC